MDQVTERNVLPAMIRPCHYRIEFETDMDAFAFKGSVEISIDVVETTSQIQLNVNQLEILNGSVVLDKPGSGSVHATHIYVDEKQETATFSFDREFKKGAKAKLIVNYSGTLSDKLAGYYKSQYMVNGETKHMAVTQFEPTDARRAFPCWDEPNIKSTFSVSMKVKREFTALSNMDVRDIIEDGDWKTVTFNTTPLMSTYLVAFVVGDLGFVEGFTNFRKEIPVRIYTPKGHEDQAGFALNIAAKTLDFFTEYLDIEYPLPKMDLIAIPDFGSGAMENWGLITFRMALLLFDQKDSTISTKKLVTYVIAHELAHQWFGNLVTMDWWSELWLNEGFATWMGWHAADHLFPQWDIWTEFYLDDSKQGLGLDALLSSHPIEIETPNPAEITQVFDSISYSKGASIIRMLNSYLGDVDFRTGLIDYLKTHEYGNAKTVDLWKAFAKASGKPVEQLMNGWTRQTGYPVISVKERFDGGKRRLEVEQNRFLLSGDSSSQDYTWSVPMNVVVYGHGPVSGQILVNKTATFEVEAEGIYNLNGNQTGFYRVLYPVNHVGQICSTMAEKQASVLDYIGVLNDAFAFGVSRRQSSVVALDLLKHFKNRTTNFFIWSEIASHLRRIQLAFCEKSEDIQTKFQTIMVDIFKGLKEEHGWDVEHGEDDQKLLLRTLVLSILCENGDLETIQEARKRFDQFVDGNEMAIHPNFKSLVFSSIVRHGSKKEYNQIFEIYQKTTVPDQKVLALLALSCTTDHELVKRTLDYTLVDGTVKSQDVVYVYRGFSKNLVAKKALWDYVETRWDQYFSRFNKGSISLLRTIVSCAAGSLVRCEDGDRVKRFFQTVDIKSISRTVDQTLEQIEVTGLWLQQDGDAISKWVSNYSSE